MVVGDTGVEPVASRMSSERSTAELIPRRIIGGSFASESSAFLAVDATMSRFFSRWNGSAFLRNSFSGACCLLSPRSDCVHGVWFI
jgi:hypothetical protein